MAVVILVAATLVLPDFAGFGFLLLPTVFLLTAIVFLLREMDIEMPNERRVTFCDLFSPILVEVTGNRRRRRP